MPSRSTSPALASTIMDPELAIRELEEKMKLLAESILGPSSISAGNNTSVIASSSGRGCANTNPFTPVSTLQSQIAILEGTLGAKAQLAEPYSAKLPAMPVPIFEGTDLDIFMQDFT